jgi:pSer/pThr/pTyr-binding forkhead associated (FHA) protein
MIPVKCPHCRIGLKVDEKKIPKGIDTFKCPKCQHDIPLSYLENKRDTPQTESTTAVYQPSKAKGGTVTVLPYGNTGEQIFHLREGCYIVGRKAFNSDADIRIETDDKMMSRSHARLEVRKDAQGGIIHCLSDNQSKNRTLHNNIFLDEGEEVVLQDNDEIKLGNTLLRFNN